MKIFLTLVLALSFAVLFLTPPHQASADEDKSKDMQAEMMAKWQAYATPGKGQQVLDQLVGDWEYTVKWWNAPGTEPQVSTGDSENEWIMGGRFIKADVEGKSMGQRFEGMGIMGYDNAKKEYTSVWIDTMGTGMMNATGSYDAAAKTITENGSYTDPMTGKGKAYKGVTTFTDKNSYTYELFTTGPDGKEFRMMEIVYKREVE